MVFGGSVGQISAKNYFLAQPRVSKRRKIQSQNQKIWKKYGYADSKFWCFETGGAKELGEKSKMGVEKGLFFIFYSQF